MWERIKTLAVSKPLWTFLIVLGLAAGIYLSISGLWSDYKFNRLQKDIDIITKERDAAKADSAAKDISIAQQNGVIQTKEKELDEKNALLQATASKVLADQKNLDTATAAYNRIMSDDTPLSKSELRDKLCSLYNIPPQSCH